MKNFAFFVPDFLAYFFYSIVFGIGNPLYLLFKNLFIWTLEKNLRITH